jgi:hypothetical protein
MLEHLVSTRRRLTQSWPRVVLATLVVGLSLVVTHNVAAAHTRSAATGVPQSAAMEDALGVRFTRVAVVGDGGLVTVTYVVLDSEKAARFQAATTDPPVLTTEKRSGGTRRVSLMRQGHDLRAGQTYYFVYQNTKGAVRAGEPVSLTKDGLTLRHVPVL